ncbi:MAG: hypothetical protein JST26_17045 [Bacteroidetes bacterium]|nr:hypothetical protein [Bacteroidota bacterium]
MNTDNTQHLEAIQDIRNMMKKSTRFLSLNGLSGVFAGIYALIGATLAYFRIHDINDIIANSKFEPGMSTNYASVRLDFYIFFFLVAGSVLVLSIATAYFLSNKKARKQGQKLFDHTAWRVLINLSIPLIAGGFLCLAFLYHGTIAYIAPAMLLFYGMALINASKYTYDDIRYFGICQSALGLVNAFDLGHGLYYWAFGFGVLHIVYGLIMWNKYERK